MTDLGPCNFCSDDPVAGFNDVLFCEQHVTEGMAEATRIMALAEGISDPQRIAAMTEMLTDMYLEAAANDNMAVGDSIYGKTNYDPGAN